jgi:hypothetical protein
MAKKVKEREIYYEVGYDRKRCRYQGGREEMRNQMCKKYRMSKLSREMRKR